jgi:threonine aldolase
MSRDGRNFTSDNVTGVAPAIIEAILAANRGRVRSYGDDPITARLAALAATVFETELAIFPVATGTAANALALATLVPPYGSVIAYDLAHIVTDECGAPEFFSGGAKLLGLPAAHGTIRPEQLAPLLATTVAAGVHAAQPAAISLTQATECGTLYSPAAIAEIAGVAKRHGLRMHMDGARLANAIARLGCSPAEATWKAGIDVLSLGATKNGALAAEAVVFFDRDLAQGFAERRKRAGHLFSKQRFVSAQLEAYFTDGLWLANATHANRLADRLGAGLAALPGVSLTHAVEANEIFAVLPDRMIDGLVADGFAFYRWPAEGGQGIRLVTAFDSDDEDVDAFLATAGRHAEAASPGPGRARKAG